ncbi:hypothetical protein M433DRAFT_143727 [Acidomyces richmondensis BFW]|nr:MAG: hypothetical protein FE78DRAFT_79793 [Acidomyces sp. 'richmondensis']KYG45692.1 hypothetical protein M433DRAFT_143727 [Acidomyces richmondensis BFW]
MADDEANGVTADHDIECGRQAAKEFNFAKEYRNLNHGSFGTYPKVIRAVHRQHLDDCELRPDQWIRFAYPRLLDDSRRAIASYVKAPVEACVFVPNATTGLNTVLRNLVFVPGDVILYFSTIYGACEKTAEYIVETTPAESWKIESFSYPHVTDEKLCELFEDAVKTIKEAGKTPKVAIYDTISSLPGIRMPFEKLTALCRTHGIFSCIDGAHSIGQIPLDMTTLDPDFFFTNCHKWLYTPRACAFFYVPVRNQHLIRSTVPTSHGFVPQPQEGKQLIKNPLPPSSKTEFVTNFEFTGTLDNTPYLCVPAALAWRRRVVWDGKRGERAVVEYMADLARLAGQTLCAFANVRLPLDYDEIANGDLDEAIKLAQWMSEMVRKENDTFIAIYVHGDAWWVRLSAQIYLTLEDFEWAGGILKRVCERVKAGEYKA